MLRRRNSGAAIPQHACSQKIAPLFGKPLFINHSLDESPAPMLTAPGAQQPVNALLEMSHKGFYHWSSKKHLRSYIDEMTSAGTCTSRTSS